MTRPGLHVQLYATGPAQGVRWRLLGANNRDLGHGLQVFADEAACRSFVLALVADAGRLSTAVERHVDRRWRWRLDLGLVPAVASSHAFDRRSRCELASCRFVRMAPLAEVRPGVAQLDHPGSCSGHLSFTR